MNYQIIILILSDAINNWDNKEKDIKHQKKILKFLRENCVFEFKETDFDVSE